jgi:hypothetical protein
MPFFADADWVQIVAALLFFLITGLAQFLQKRSREKRGLAPAPEPDEFLGPVGEPERGLPPVMEERRPLARDNWEEQLRKLLQGEEPAPPPEIAPTPPPTLSRIPPEPAETYSYEEQVPPRAEVPLEETTVGGGARAGVEWIREARQSVTPRLAAAAEAYQHAASFGTLRGQPRRDRALPAVSRSLRGRPSATTASVVALFRRPQTVRQAIIAATILQPPKALE